MNRLFCLLTSVLCFACILSAEDTVISRWQDFEVNVRDQKIGKKEAKIEFKELINELTSYAEANFKMPKEGWIFPIENYGLKSMNPKDFRPRSYYGPYGIKGYDFFDGNRHGGHPAHDIFIRDKNQDSLDDRTNKKVQVIAMTDMLVLSTNSGWEPESKIRGGNYIWLFNSQEKKLFYYAHLSDILVRPGQFVKKGEALGSVGRTGATACKKKSATHLHLMVLDISERKLVPFDYYPLFSKKKMKK